MWVTVSFPWFTHENESPKGTTHSNPERISGKTHNNNPRCPEKGNIILAHVRSNERRDSTVINRELTIVRPDLSRDETPAKRTG